MKLLILMAMFFSVNAFANNSYAPYDPNNRGVLAANDPKLSGQNCSHAAKTTSIYSERATNNTNKANQ